MKEKVSIVLPVYNGKKYVGQSIESCLDQSYKNLELIIVDDGSTDQTPRTISQYKDRRIKLLKHKRNKGLSNALNTGFEKATGEYLTWTSHDNYYKEDAIEKMLSFLKEKNCDFVYCDFYRIGGEKLTNLKRVNLPPSSPLEKENGIGACFLYSKKVKETVGNYNPEKILAEDYDYWMRVSKKFAMQHLAEPLYFYREHNKSLSSKMLTEVAIAGVLVGLENRKDDIELSVDYLINATVRQKPGKTKIRKALAKILLSRKVKKVLEKFKNQQIGLEEAKTSLKEIISPKKASWLFMIVYNGKSNLKNLARKLLYSRPQTRLSHPASIVFLMKNSCNSKCVMCGLNYAGCDKKEEISLDNYKQLLSNLKMNKVKDITFSGGGEPLLCKDFTKILCYTNETYPKIELNLFTNGIALEKKIALELIKKNTKKIVVSINAATDKTHKMVTCTNSFNKVIDNIQNLIMLRNKLNKNTEVELSFVASALNIADLPILVKLASELQADGVNTQYCRFYSHKLDLNSAKPNSVFDKRHSLLFCKGYSDKVMEEALFMAKLKKIKFRYEPLFGNKNHLKRKCHWPLTTILIGPGGEIYPCGGGEVMFFKAVKEKKLYFGNLLKEQITEFWNNKDFKRIRQSSDFLNKNKTIRQCWNCNHTMSWEGPNNEKSHFIDVEL